LWWSCLSRLASPRAAPRESQKNWGQGACVGRSRKAGIYVDLDTDTVHHHRSQHHRSRIYSNKAESRISSAWSGYPDTRIYGPIYGHRKEASKSRVPASGSKRKERPRLSHRRQKRRLGLFQLSALQRRRLRGSRMNSLRRHHCGPLWFDIVHGST